MATNVTEKDKTLQEIIDWCEQLEIDGLRLANALLMQRDTTAYGVVKGQIDAYGKTADHCRSMLGYSGSMLSCPTYEDTDNSDPSDQHQVGDYGVAVRETADATNSGVQCAADYPKSLRAIHRMGITSSRYTGFNAPESTSLQTGTATLWMQASSGNT